MPTFYAITAYNTAALYLYGNAADATRYTEWLNRNRDSNLYASDAINESQCAAMDQRDDVVIATEPHWDSFMEPTS